MYSSVHQMLAAIFLLSVSVDWSVKLDYSWYHIRVESHSICPLVTFLALYVY